MGMRGKGRRETEKGGRERGARQSEGGKCDVGAGAELDGEGGRGRREARSTVEPQAGTTGMFRQGLL